jgi:hypothetical protein
MTPMPQALPVTVIASPVSATTRPVMSSMRLGLSPTIEDTASRYAALPVGRHRDPAQALCKCVTLISPAPQKASEWAGWVLQD